MAIRTLIALRCCRSIDGRLRRRVFDAAAAISGRRNRQRRALTVGAAGGRPFLPQQFAADRASFRPGQPLQLGNPGPVRSRPLTGLPGDHAAGQSVAGADPASLFQQCRRGRRWRHIRWLLCPPPTPSPRDQIRNQLISTVARFRRTTPMAPAGIARSASAPAMATIFRSSTARLGRPLSGRRPDVPDVVRRQLAGPVVRHA